MSDRASLTMFIRQLKIRDIPVTILQKIGYFLKVFFTKNIKKGGKQLWQSTILESPILYQTLPIMNGATTVSKTSLSIPMKN